MSKSPIFFAMVLVGFVAQLVDGTLGMGYGVFSTSLLIGMGFYPAIASASVHTARIFTVLLSGASHFRLGNVERNLALHLTIPGIIGGIVGAYLLCAVPGKTAQPLISIALLGMGVLVLYRFITGKVPSASGDNRVPLPKLLGLGFVAALMDAVGGGGWGPIATPGLILTGDHEPRKVVGSVNLVKFFVTMAEVLTFIFILGLKRLRWDMVCALWIGGAVAAPIAAFACRRLPDKALGILIGIALIGLNASTLVLSFLR
ncbi:MAG: sulfite exporter TauE/SafE family protein [Candidatus Binatia bacterium]